MKRGVLRESPSAQSASVSGREALLELARRVRSPIALESEELGRLLRDPRQDCSSCTLEMSTLVLKCSGNLRSMSFLVLSPSGRPLRAHAAEGHGHPAVEDRHAATRPTFFA